ncbi:MAG: hypothetical protein WC326_02975 [Candidatus Delongbacteria bacterium]
MTVRSLAGILSILLLVISAQAQFKDRADVQPLAGLVMQPMAGLNLQGPLLDPARMHLSQSVSMGFASGGGGSVGTGLYLNQLDYRLSSTLDMRLQLGVNSVFHNSVVPGMTGQGLVGGAEFVWRPNADFEMRLAASRGPATSRSWPGAWASPLDGWSHP